MRNLWKQIVQDTYGKNNERFLNCDANICIISAFYDWNFNAARDPFSFELIKISILQSNDVSFLYIGYQCVCYPWKGQINRDKHIEKMLKIYFDLFVHSSQITRVKQSLDSLIVYSFNHIMSYYHNIVFIRNTLKNI